MVVGSQGVAGTRCEMAALVLCLGTQWLRPLLKGGVGVTQGGGSDAPPRPPSTTMSDAHAPHLVLGKLLVITVVFGHRPGRGV